MEKKKLQLKWRDEIHEKFHWNVHVPTYRESIEIP